MVYEILLPTWSNFQGHPLEYLIVLYIPWYPHKSFLLIPQDAIHRWTPRHPAEHPNPHVFDGEIHSLDSLVLTDDIVGNPKP